MSLWNQEEVSAVVSSSTGTVVEVLQSTRGTVALVDYGYAVHALLTPLDLSIGEKVQIETRYDVKQSRITISVADRF